MVGQDRLKMEDVVWFSQKEDRYDAEVRGNKRVVEWSNRSEIWDWNNCTVSAVSKEGGKVRVVVRSTNTIHSDYMKRDVKIRYMLGFDAARVQQPSVEDYHEPPMKNIVGKVYGPPRARWVVELEGKYWIWEWAVPGQSLENSAVYRVYEMITKKLVNPDLGKSETFDVPTADDGRVIHVVYQPALDSWKNFLREIHCHLDVNGELEVTLLFNNEQLRRHAILNKVYEWIRSLIWKRTIDVETFRVKNRDDPEKFRFAGIYSGENNIQQDDVHGDKPDVDGRVSEHQIKYYYSNDRHPIVFVNTSNHAMGEHDTNHRLWKWEYVGWEKDSSVIVGDKSRQEIDRMFNTRG